MQAVWDQILNILSQIITPDWGSLIALLPLALLGLVVLYVLWLGWSFTRVGPRRRGRTRLMPAPPPGVHPPVPSFAPFFGAIATFLVLFALVAGGIAIPLAAIGMSLALLYWGREAMREHDQLLGRDTALVVVREGPPPGVHAPVPSFQPILASIALAIIFFGLVFGPALLLVGIATLVISLLGWLRDARREYRLVEEADQSGHLRPPPTPAFPVGTLALFVVLVGAAIIIQSGVLPPKTSTTAAAGSPAPGASAKPSGGPGGSVPSNAPAPKGDVSIVAEAIQFTTTDVSGPAGKPFTIAFTNKDPATMHNVDVKDASGKDVFKGDLLTGPSSTVYNVPALAAGTYPFTCTVHPTMTGTLTIK
jgi:plastocyanin